MEIVHVMNHIDLLSHNIMARIRCNWQFQMMLHVRYFKSDVWPMPTN